MPSLAPATIVTSVTGSASAAAAALGDCPVITVVLIAAMTIIVTAITTIGPSIPAICRLAVQRKVLHRLPDGPLSAEDAAKLLRVLTRPGS